MPTQQSLAIGWPPIPIHILFAALLNIGTVHLLFGLNAHHLGALAVWFIGTLVINSIKTIVASTRLNLDNGGHLGHRNSNISPAASLISRSLARRLPAPLGWLCMGLTVVCRTIVGIYWAVTTLLRVVGSVCLVLQTACRYGARFFGLCSNAINSRDAAAITIAKTLVHVGNVAYRWTTFLTRTVLVVVHGLAVSLSVVLHSVASLVLVSGGPLQACAMGASLMGSGWKQVATGLVNNTISSIQEHGRDLGFPAPTNVKDAFILVFEFDMPGLVLVFLFRLAFATCKHACHLIRKTICLVNSALKLALEFDVLEMAITLALCGVFLAGTYCYRGLRKSIPPLVALTLIIISPFEYIYLLAIEVLALRVDGVDSVNAPSDAVSIKADPLLSEDESDTTSDDSVTLPEDFDVSFEDPDATLCEPTSAQSDQCAIKCEVQALLPKSVSLRAIFKHTSVNDGVYSDTLDQGLGKATYLSSTPQFTCVVATSTSSTSSPSDTSFVSTAGSPSTTIPQSYSIAHAAAETFAQRLCEETSDKNSGGKQQLHAAAPNERTLAHRARQKKAKLLKQMTPERPRRERNAGRKAGLALDIAADVAEYAAWADEAEDDYDEEVVAALSRTCCLIYGENGRWTGKGVWI
ncbi:hypothetical protein C8Q80DRAFT_1267829 [Daedaleopsis nitida]|nr:hypothetical protein C8Q80DRAFT_1267829 [Daedaleopsis nitida]